MRRFFPPPAALVFISESARVPGAVPPLPVSKSEFTTGSPPPMRPLFSHTRFLLNAELTSDLSGLTNPEERIL